MASAAGLAPVPDSSAAAEPPRVPDTRRLANFTPVVVGANDALIEQDAPAASVAPSHVSPDFANWSWSPLLSEVDKVPVGTPPVLVTVKAWIGLVVPVATSSKSFSCGAI